MNAFTFKFEKPLTFTQWGKPVLEYTQCTDYGNRYAVGTFCEMKRSDNVFTVLLHRPKSWTYITGDNVHTMSKEIQREFEPFEYIGGKWRVKGDSNANQD